MNVINHFNITAPAAIRKIWQSIVDLLHPAAKYCDKLHYNPYLQEIQEIRVDISSVLTFN